MSYAACKRDRLGSNKLMQPTRVQGIECSIEFKNSDLRSKCTNDTVYVISLQGHTAQCECKVSVNQRFSGSIVQ